MSQHINYFWPAVVLLAYGVLAALIGAGLTATAIVRPSTEAALTSARLLRALGLLMAGLSVLMFDGLLYFGNLHDPFVLGGVILMGAFAIGGMLVFGAGERTIHRAHQRELTDLRHRAGQP